MMNEEDEPGEDAFMLPTPIPEQEIHRKISDEEYTRDNYRQFNSATSRHNQSGVSQPLNIPVTTCKPCMDDIEIFECISVYQDFKKLWEAVEFNLRNLSSCPLIVENKISKLPGDKLKNKLQYIDHGVNFYKHIVDRLQMYEKTWLQSLSDLYIGVLTSFELFLLNTPESKKYYRYRIIPLNIRPSKKSRIDNDGDVCKITNDYTEEDEKDILIAEDFCNWFKIYPEDLPENPGVFLIKPPQAKIASFLGYSSNLSDVETIQSQSFSFFLRRQGSRTLMSYKATKTAQEARELFNHVKKVLNL